MALLCFFSVLMMEEIEISKLCTSLEPTIDWSFCLIERVNQTIKTASYSLSPPPLPPRLAFPSLFSRHHLVGTVDVMQWDGKSPEHQAFLGEKWEERNEKGKQRRKTSPPPLSLSPLPSPPSKISSAPVPKEGLILRLGEKKWKKAALKGFFCCLFATSSSGDLTTFTISKRVTVLPPAREGRGER